MRGGIVITARAVGVHVISVVAALAHDELRGRGRIWSNAVLLATHCANHTCASVGECAMRHFLAWPHTGSSGVNPFCGDRAEL
jgi:hypothetical protein